MAGMLGNLDSAGNMQNEGFTPSELPKLPTEQLKVMRYIMKNGSLTYNQIRDGMAALPDEEAVPPEQLLDTLNALIADGHITQEGRGMSVTYRVPLRRKAGRVNILGIWQALEADEKTGLTPEHAINPELRMTRSALTDRVLTDLGKYFATPADASDTRTAPTEQNTSLLKALFDTGSRAMAKRNRVEEPLEQSAVNVAPVIPNSPIEAMTSPPKPDNIQSATLLSRISNKLWNLLGGKKR